jgi:hypothetical protein
LKEFFSDFGPVVSCEVVRDHIKGWSRGLVTTTPPYYMILLAILKEPLKGDVAELAMHA